MVVVFPLISIGASFYPTYYRKFKEGGAQYLLFTISGRQLLLRVNSSVITRLLRNGVTLTLLRLFRRRMYGRAVALLLMQRNYLIIKNHARSGRVTLEVLLLKFRNRATN